MSINKILLWRNVGTIIFTSGLIGLIFAIYFEINRQTGFFFGVFGFMGGAISFLVNLLARCPKCNQRFFISNTTGNIFSNKCVNCGHSKVKNL